MIKAALAILHQEDAERGPKDKSMSLSPSSTAPAPIGSRRFVMSLSSSVINAAIAVLLLVIGFPFAGALSAAGPAGITDPREAKSGEFLFKSQQFAV